MAAIADDAGSPLITARRAAVTGGFVTQTLEARDGA